MWAILCEHVIRFSYFTPLSYKAAPSLIAQRTTSADPFCGRGKARLGAALKVDWLGICDKLRLFTSFPLVDLPAGSMTLAGFFHERRNRL